MSLLDRLSPSTMKFGLERMRACDAALGHPWRSYRSLHVAGTNGKGSTCAFAEAILRAAGLKVGLYTSPHLERVNERIRVDGRDITDAELERGIASVVAAYAPAGDPAHEDSLTYFEFLTALAFEHFRAERVDVAIIEVGLGGRLDATNVITPTACAIATIGFDHTEYLGNTLGAIATEKAGILKPGVPAAVLVGQPEARAAIAAVAKERGCPVRWHGPDFALEGGALRLGARRIDGIRLALAGEHQLGNAALAAQAATLVHDASDAAIRDGLAGARWPGRLERLGDALLDGAHNPEGAAALARELERLGRPVHLVFGVLGDKAWAEMVDTLAPRATALYAVNPRSPRALAAEQVAGAAARHTRASAFASVGEALALAQAAARADGGQVVVAGSLYLVGEARQLLSAG